MHSAAENLDALQEELMRLPLGEYLELRRAFAEADAPGLPAQIQSTRRLRLQLLFQASMTKLGLQGIELFAPPCLVLNRASPSRSYENLNGVVPAR